MADSYFPGRGMTRRDRAAGLCLSARKPRPGGMEYMTDRFCAAREFQRRGAGGMFLSMGDEEAKRIGMNAVILTAGRCFPAESFYMKNNFRLLDNLAAFGKKMK